MVTRTTGDGRLSRHPARDRSRRARRPDANVAPARAEESLRLRHPFVWLIGRDTTRRGLERLDSLDAPVLIARLPELPRRLQRDGEPPPLASRRRPLLSWSRGGEVGIRGYEALVRMTLVATQAFQEDLPPDLATIAERLRNAAGNTAAEVRSPAP